MVLRTKQAAQQSNFATFDVNIMLMPKLILRMTSKKSRQKPAGIFSSGEVTHLIEIPFRTFMMLFPSMAAPWDQAKSVEITSLRHNCISSKKPIFSLGFSCPLRTEWVEESRLHSYYTVNAIPFLCHSSLECPPTLIEACPGIGGR